MKIICLGDSFTSGYKISEGKRWTNLLEDMMGIEISNKGIHGDTTSGILSRFNNDITGENAKYVLIEGGFNDFLVGVDENIVESNITSLIYQTYNSRMIPVVLLQPVGDAGAFIKFWPNFVDINRIQSKMVIYQKWLVEFCRAFSIYYIDLTEISTYCDGIHLDEEGHKKVSEKIFEFFSSIR